ncbi:MAG: hypothetical protein ACXWXQ_10440 [Actinomycetota bacterium]
MRIGGRKRRGGSFQDPAITTRFEYCCGAECDEECRRQAMHEAFVRMTPVFDMRMG